jgi:hypothetical protein
MLVMDREKSQTQLREALATYTFIRKPHHIESTEDLLDRAARSVKKLFARDLPPPAGFENPAK